MALFTYKDINNSKAKENENFSPKMQNVSFSNDIKNGLRERDLHALFSSIEKKKIYHLPSFGQWSLHHVVERCVGLIGPAELVASSWAISETAMRCLINLHSAGAITDINLLLDSKVRAHHKNAWQLISSVVSNIGLYKCHAKIVVLTNENYQVTIITSANFSVNRRIEVHCVIEDDKTAAFYSAEWLRLIKEHHISTYGIK